MKRLIEILIKNGYEIKILSEDLVEIHTKELLPNNDLLSIYLIYKNGTIILLEEDSIFELDIVEKINIKELKKIAKKYNINLNIELQEFYKENINEFNIIENLKNIINTALEAGKLLIKKENKTGNKNI